MPTQMMNLLKEDPAQYAVVVFAIILSITLHELAHGWTAVWFGDRTPIETDHLTPNPLVHMGFFSIVMVFLFGIGWGAMPVNPSRMRGRYADAFVSAAGPAMNVLIAFVAVTTIGVGVRVHAFAITDGSFVETLFLVLEYIARLNLLLAMFNLLPIPPLDGSRILASLVPAYRDWAFTPTMIGVWQAVFFAAFFFVGAVFSPIATRLIGNYLHLIVTVGRL